MRRESGIAVFAALVLMAVACPKKEKEATPQTAAKLSTIYLSEAKQCPDDMAWVGPARICIDLYEYPNASGEVPLQGITYEQATAMCEAEGKRLPTAEEWTIACAGPFENVYPYGDEHKKDACLDDQDYSADLKTSGEKKKCRSGYGVYDMTGSLWEWTSSDGYQKGTKYVKGGSWRSFPYVAACDIKAWEKPDGGGDDYGFRCAIQAKTVTF